MRALLVMVWLLMGWLPAGHAEQRFPPPEFESHYEIPASQHPLGRGLWFEYLDVAVLLGALGVGWYLALRRRSRLGLAGLSVFSLVYFGFYRQGCVCAIGSVQNVTLGLFGSDYAVPLGVIFFFGAPLLVSLFAGRIFCSGVCPHGALQDLLLLKPIKVPRWLEQGLGLLPYVYLGAAILFAATESAFIICEYDPFIGIFRLTGQAAMLAVGGLFIVTSMFIGRPYCRFLCPYGALLRIGSTVSKWRVTVTPNQCTQCRLCEEACPYGAIEEPRAAPVAPRQLKRARGELFWSVGLTAMLVAGVGWLGGRLGEPMSHLHPDVQLASQFLSWEHGDDGDPEALAKAEEANPALKRARSDPEPILTAAAGVQEYFLIGGWLLGGWIGLVFGLKLVRLSLRHGRTDFEPDRAKCFACGRCFASCPNERTRWSCARDAVPAAFPASMKQADGTG